MKRYLLMAGDCYYPENHCRDWIGVFETEQEAAKYIRQNEEYDGESDLGEYEFFENGAWHCCAWYTIVDLQKVMETGEIPT